MITCPYEMLIIPQSNTYLRKGIRKLRLDFLLKRGEFAPILRRFFINTLFDSTFMQMGIIIGSAFTVNPDLDLVMGTLVASSIALGISTGVSIYESEMLERESRITELEKVMFRKLDDTILTEHHRTSAIIFSVINLLTPLLCCAIVIIPLLFASVNILDIRTASWISIGLALCILFVAGTYMGRLGRKNPYLKGLRMVLFGAVAFVIGFAIQRLI